MSDLSSKEQLAEILSDAHAIHCAAEVGMPCDCRVPDAIAELLRRAEPPPSRIGPTEPDDTMVICPVCTSQFRAIPLDVQWQLAFLSAPERGERGTSRLGSSARELPAAETAESADERESTADSPDRRDTAARVAAPEGRNRKPSDASLGKDAPGHDHDLCERAAIARAEGRSDE
jgi:hypothetical protein